MKKIIISAIAAALLTVSSQVISEVTEEVSPIITTENMNNQVKHDTLVVQGKCGMCKTRIEKAAKSVKGVSSASWSLETKQLLLDFDQSKTSLEAISKAIAKVGHDTEKDKTNEAVYKTLPGCCKYRE